MVRLFTLWIVTYREYENKQQNEEKNIGTVNLLSKKVLVRLFNLWIVQYQEADETETKMQRQILALLSKILGTFCS